METPAKIYETRGRAREYNELALNIYRGCAHQCAYCSSPLVLRETKETLATAKPRVNLGVLDKQAYGMARKGEKRPVLLCFTTDPYQPIEAELKLTRNVIGILHDYLVPVIILTKAGKLAQRDFDLLRPGDQFATTLTFANDIESKAWEPGAGTPMERMVNLEAAHKLGIETWVSCEPVIDPAQTRYLINQARHWTGHYKIGKLNYHPRAKQINWRDFAGSLLQLQREVQRPFYIKKDLAAFCGRKEGFWFGCTPTNKGGE